MTAGAGSDVMVESVRLLPMAAPETKAVVAIWVVLVPAAAVGAVGVPVKAGETLKTTVEPVPVVVAAEMAVPFPARTGELMVVEIVMAGVVVGVATEPAKPLALVTETLVTVPLPPPPVPVEVWVPNSPQFVPTGLTDRRP